MMGQCPSNSVSNSNSNDDDNGGMIHDSLDAIMSSSLLPTMVTLPSIDPKRDAHLLMQLFSQVNFALQEQPDDSFYNNNNLGENNSAKILVHGESGFTIILLQIGKQQPTAATITSTTTWVVPEAVISKLLLAQEKNPKEGLLQQQTLVLPENGDGSSQQASPATVFMASISLTNATSRILLLPPVIAATPQGRSALSQYLVRHQQREQQQQQPSQQPLFINGAIQPQQQREDDVESAAGMDGDNTQVVQSRNPRKDNRAIETIVPLETNDDEEMVNGSSPLLPYFPTLQASVLQQNGQMDYSFPINARAPIRFETDLFQGQCLLLIKPEQAEDDEYWTERLFAEKKRRFVLQIQGKLKRKPQGQVYLGAEITKPMKVGLLTRAVLGILIRLLESFFSDLRYSFGSGSSSGNGGDDTSNGDTKKQEQHEYPRVVAPAHLALERLVVTPAGQVPPDITCEPFDESVHDKKRRLASKSFEWNDTDTYSMSFYSMYLSCVDWQLVNLPVSGDINLQTLWNDSAMRIVLYETASENSKKKQQHLQKLNRYAFTLQIQYLGKQQQQQQQQQQQDERGVLKIQDNLPDDVYANTKGADDFTATVDSFRRASMKRIDSSTAALLGGLLQQQEEDLNDSTPRGLTAVALPPVDGDMDYYDDDDDSLFFFDALESNSDTFVDHGTDNSSAITTTTTTTGTTEQQSPRPFSKSTKLLAKIDSTVPAWIDMLSSSTGKVGRSYTRVYAVASSTTNTAGNATRFCSKQACTTFVEESDSSWQDVSRILEDNFSSRLSHAELTRRGLALLLDPPTGMDGLQKKRSEAFVAQKCVADKQFLRGRTEPAVGGVLDKKRPPPLISGFCARAHSDRHWVEEWVKVSAVNLMVSFYNPDKLRHPHLRIAISSIDKVERVNPAAGDANTPKMPEFSFLKIHQVYGRSIYLMFASDSERDRWLEFLVNMIPPTGSSSAVAIRPGGGESSFGSVGDSCMGSGARAWSVGFVDDPIEQFFHNSSMWDCRNRRILNCGQLYFRVGNENNGDEENALEAVQKTLRLAIDTVNYEDNKAVDVERRRRFLDSAASLKRVCVGVLSEEARVAFFLNLYHVMILHAFLIVGPPGSWFKWFSYFNNIAYQVDDDIFSLAELEHAIIRSQMSHPANFLSRFVIPKSNYRFGITRSDFRINFALNCGSLSNPPTIPIYSAERLEEQLDEASRLYLEDVVVKVTKRSQTTEVSINLPRVCQWFAEDFGSSQSDLLVKVEPFLKKSERDKLIACHVPREQRRYDVRYKDYNFQCRSLALESSYGE